MTNSLISNHNVSDNKADKNVLVPKGVTIGLGVFALILAVAVAGVMGLHTRNVQETAGNAQLQRAYWIVSNAYQRFQINHSLSTSDVKELEQQATTAGLNSAQIINDGSAVGLTWRAWDAQSRVQRGCAADQAFSCIQVKIK